MKKLDDHYTQMGIEPIVYSDTNNLDPYQHTVIKYVTRWRAKGGIRDLKAAMVILQKYIDKEEELATPDERQALQNIIDQMYKAKALDNYDRIVTVGRGGMWAAANLAYALNINQVETMQIRSINRLEGDNILFVDGIVDTGKTIEKIKIDTASLYTKKSTSTYPDYTGKVLHSDEYFELPISQPFDKEEHA